MAKIIDNKSGKSVDVKDGLSIIPACEKLGVPFSCRVGVCGICRIKIISGAENLSEITSEEKNYSCTKDSRLACQVKIKSGEVKIEF